MQRTSFRFMGLGFLVVALGIVVLAPSSAAATKVIKNKTFTSYRLPAGAHDRIYQNCVFKGGSRTRAVLTIDRAARNIVFRDCVIARGGGWNGVSINDRLGNIHHIRFNRVKIKTQGRMGMEITSRPASGSRGYRAISIVNSTLEPQGSQAVSFDGGAGARDCTFRNNVVKGAGVNPRQQWGHGFELNGPSRFRVIDNRFYQCRDAIFNLQRHTTARSGWVFKRNRLDASRHVQRVRMDRNEQVVIGNNLYGGYFLANRVIADAPGGGVAWFGNSHHMNWSTTKWRDARGGGYKRPMAQEGSSHNRF